jgi:sulfur-oxidizing protein SoxZ
MAKSIKIRAKEKNGVVELKALMSHQMQPSGQKDKKTGEPIPPHFIQEVTCTVGDRTVMTAQWSGGVSKNPYLACKFKGTKGEKVTLAWVDNKGESDSQEAEIK